MRRERRGRGHWRRAPPGWVGLPPRGGNPPRAKEGQEPSSHLHHRPPFPYTPAPAPTTTSAGSAPRCEPQSACHFSGCLGSHVPTSTRCSLARVRATYSTRSSSAIACCLSRSDTSTDASDG